MELHTLKIASEQTINDNLHTELVFSDQAKQRILELYNATFVAGKALKDAVNG